MNRNSNKQNIYLESSIHDYIFLEKLKSILDLDIFFKETSIYLKQNFQINKIDIQVKYKNEKDILYKNYLLDEKKLSFKIYIKVHKNTYIIYNIIVKNIKQFLVLNSDNNSLKIFFHNISQILFTAYLQEKIEHLKLQDPLTSFYNREYLSLYLNKMLPLSKREDKKIAFLLLGIDHFKAVIDEFTYDIGDKLLLSLSKLLSYHLRSSDLIIKLDKDEFLLVLPNIINEKNAIMISKKIIKSFAQSKIVIDEESKQTLQKTICVGISIYPDDSISTDEILRHADVSLYEAKNVGRSSYFKFNKNSSIDLF